MRFRAGFGFADLSLIVDEPAASDGCEFDGPAGAEDFDTFFPDYESLLAYCLKRFKNWNQRFKKEEKKEGSPDRRCG